MKLYVISGLGADQSVFEKIIFPAHLEVVFIDWLIPFREESFQNYVERMSKSINSKEPFYLLGYSLGGIIAQEIHKKIPAQKVIILASIKSQKGKSKLMQLGKFSKIYKALPTSVFNEKSYSFYAFVRHIFESGGIPIHFRNFIYCQWVISCSFLLTFVHCLICSFCWCKFIAIFSNLPNKIRNNFKFIFMNEVIGLRIKELRKEKKLTQKLFSAEIGIDDSQLSKIEQGKLMPTLMQLLEISSIFKVSLDWLTGQGSMLNEPTQPIVSSSQPQQNDKYIALLEKQVAQLEKINTLQEEKIADLEEKLKFAEFRDKKDMDFKIKAQRKEKKEKDEIIIAQNNTINLQNEEINALKSRHLPPDERLQPSQRV